MFTRQRLFEIRGRGAATLAIASMLLAGAAGLASCDESTSEEVEEAVEETQEAAEEAADEAEEAIDEAADELDDAADEATDPPDDSGAH